jgi:FMN-dependent NADH-azoreductase
MKTLLVINSSGRVTRSITRQLTSRFAEGWQTLHPNGSLLVRDVGTQAPSAVDEAWIAAAFTPANERTVAMRETLMESETLVEEIFRADAIVFGVPMYNFGMPGQLKAWCDQIVRIGRTFALDATAADPYRPLLPAKPVVVMISAGNGSLHPGGSLAHLNFLEPHLATILGFVGLTDITFIRAGYEEYQDERWLRSLAAAEADSDRLLASWADSEARSAA